MLFQDPQIVTIGDKSCKMFAPDEFIDKTNSVLYNTCMPDKKKIPFWIYYNSDNIGPDLHIEEFGFGISTPGYTFTETRNNYLLEFVLNGLTHVSVEKSPSFPYKKEKLFYYRPIYRTSIPTIKKSLTRELGYLGRVTARVILRTRCKR